jgi:UDP-GlcNAc:undecaprenyl-phosphate GlcNAc-1-phosphate transferase
MQVDLFSYLAIGLVAAIATGLTVPVFRAVALARGAQVLPNERAVHAEPTPTLGGGGMFVGFITAMAVAAATGWFPDAFSGTSEPWAIFGCGIIAYGVGVVDDLKEISAPAKTAGIVLAGSMLYLLGVSIIYFRIPFIDPIVVDPGLAYLLTVVWVMGMANAVNFIDGLDGLAAGIVGIGALAFFFYALRLLEVGFLISTMGPLLLIIVFGICVGFLPYNVHPAHIFMGDGGAILLGSLMAASTMAVGGRTPDPFSGQTFFFYAPLVIPLLILGVPIVDTIFAIIRRATRRQSLATADKDHMHHRLMRLGHGHARSVFILWAWTALLSGFVLWPVYNEGSGDAIVPVGVAALGLILFTLFAPGFQRQRTT